MSMNSVKTLMVGSMFFVLISSFSIGIANLSKMLIQ
ncbi:hypothetical protein EV214_11261 [Marinisporobacter balticus]|uniref:Uncharacterized protein n=1 Tax=Marinisporobacter balticus TaxID=2018667 RepID=A0A4R2KPA7_9FIRM|nr:hypothetical protein EV214_11261 [Marinisporobacter balticus]